MPNTFKTLDYLPIDESILDSDIRSDPELALTAKRQMAFAHHCLQCEARLENLTSLSLSSLRSSNEERESIHFFTILLISRLLSISAIHDEGIETPAYKRYKAAIGKDKRLPSPERLRAISYGISLSWGTMYGSLGYYLHFGNPIHYASPSQLARAASTAYLSILGSNLLDTPTEDVIYSLLQLLEDPSLEADWGIYSSISFLLDTLDSVDRAFNYLHFMQSWLPSLISWFAGDFNSALPIPTLPTKQDARAYETLCRLGKLLIAYGYDYSTPLSFEYIHQLLPDSWGALYSDILIALKQTAYDMSLPIEVGSLADKLLVPALKVIPPTADPDGFRYGTQTLIESLGVGGFDMFCIAIAIELINRCHILTVPSRYDTEDLKRPLGLLHLSSLVLKRSSLQSIRALGIQIGKVCGSPYTGKAVIDLGVL